jgi:hypothetical protein
MNYKFLVYAVLEDAQGMTLTYEDSWGTEKYTIAILKTNLIKYLFKLTPINLVLANSQGNK